MKQQVFITFYYSLISVSLLSVPILAQSGNSRPFNALKKSESVDTTGDSGLDEPKNGSAPTDDKLDNNQYSDTDSNSKDLLGHGDTFSNLGSDQALPKPSDLMAIRLNETSIVLRWDIAEESSSRLESFKVQYKPAKKDAKWYTDLRDIPPTARAYQINRLRPGAYVFHVHAVYDTGETQDSEKFKFRIRAAKSINPNDLPEQEAPVFVWENVEHNVIRFRWKYRVKDADVRDFGYLVYYRSAHAVTDFTIYHTDDEDCEIVDVEPDTPYETMVVAYNKVGVSKFSELKRIKSAPESNVTTTEMPPTQRPGPLDTISTTDAITKGPITVMTTPNPLDKSSETTKNPNLAETSTTIESIEQYLRNLLGATDQRLISIYAILIALPILLITTIILILIGCKQNSKTSPPESATTSQYDLEIDSYFKNSFPGTQEKCQVLIPNHHSNQGFIEKHPHIHDFA